MFVAVLIIFLKIDNIIEKFGIIVLLILILELKALWMIKMSIIGARKLSEFQILLNLVAKFWKLKEKYYYSFWANG